jgi:hypothetical protein
MIYRHRQLPSIPRQPSAQRQRRRSRRLGRGQHRSAGSRLDSHPARPQVRATRIRVRRIRHLVRPDIRSWNGYPILPESRGLSAISALLRQGHASAAARSEFISEPSRCGQVIPGRGLHFEATPTCAPGERRRWRMKRRPHPDVSARRCAPSRDYNRNVMPVGQASRGHRHTGSWVVPSRGKRGAAA